MAWLGWGKPGHTVARAHEASTLAPWIVFGRLAWRCCLPSWQVVSNMFFLKQEKTVPKNKCDDDDDVVVVVVVVVNESPNKVDWLGREPRMTCFQQLGSSARSREEACSFVPSRCLMYLILYYSRFFYKDTEHLEFLVYPRPSVLKVGFQTPVANTANQHRQIVAHVLVLTIVDVYGFSYGQYIAIMRR